MLTIAVLILIGILLVHLLKDVVKAAVLVVAVLGVIYLTRGVSFEALVDQGARELYNDAPSCHVSHPTHSFRL